MPFTPTHVLAILPVAAMKRPVVPFSALVIGSIIPDLPLFLPSSPSYEMTHSVPGIVTACLPLGLVAFLLFQFVMKRPLFALLPAALRRRCASFVPRRQPLTLEAISRASLAVVIGASTHILWDSFSHRGRWGTHLVPWLNQTALIVNGHDIPGYKLLQYGSTLVGLPCLAILLAAWLCRPSPGAVDDEGILGLTTRACIGMGLVAIPLATGVHSWLREDLPGHERLEHSITTSGLTLMVVSLTYCLVFHAVDSRLPR